MNKYTYIQIVLYIYIYIGLFVYIYIYIGLFVYIYIYIYIGLFGLSSSWGFKRGKLGPQLQLFFNNEPGSLWPFSTWGLRAPKWKKAIFINYLSKKIKQKKFDKNIQLNFLVIGVPSRSLVAHHSIPP